MNQQVPTNQQQMTADRNALSDKELHYLKDFLSWELLAMKKCSDTAARCTDPGIQTAIKEAGKTHMQHFNTLLGHLH